MSLDVWTIDFAPHRGTRRFRSSLELLRGFRGVAEHPGALVQRPGSGDLWCVGRCLLWGARGWERWNFAKVWVWVNSENSWCPWSLAIFCQHCFCQQTQQILIYVYNLIILWYYIYIYILMYIDRECVCISMCFYWCDRSIQTLAG